MSKSLDLEVAYYHLPRRAGVREDQFARRTLSWSVPVEQAALVLVDVWGDHYVATHRDRSRQITLERIIPVIEAFRNVGGTIIHAPSPDCARKYSQWLQYAGDSETGAGGGGGQDDWPPADFRARRGEYEQFARPDEPADEEFDRIIAQRHIVPEVAPQAGDFVVVNGAQLHRLLKHRRMLHLFYAGFAANMCVPFRDYGMRAMKDRGYEVVLVRDGTSAIEVGDTYADFRLTEAAAIDVELNIGYTVTSFDLVAACQPGQG
ncbi:MAG: isochorismatase family protein [Candidatus Latescibacteria bacterium]|nr:isochorismatase family protein [Candidatus Latescibacterota bacterium]